MGASMDADSREAFERLRLSMECDQCHRPFILTNMVITKLDLFVGLVVVEARGRSLGRSPLLQYENPIDGKLVYICKDCKEEYSGEKRTG